MGSWSRIAVGALKDAASVGFAIMSYVGLANTITAINTRLADIDVAFVKVTRHNDKPLKEKHLLVLIAATQEQGLRPYIKQVVEERLSRTKNWMVAVKTLTLIHRLIRDAPRCIFVQQDQEKQSSSDTTPLVGVSQSFMDCCTPLALQFSIWVRKYASYLAQRLQRKSNSNYLTLAEYRSVKIGQLLEDFRSLHLLLGCLLDCTPQEGPVAMNPLIHYALDLLVTDCPQIYGAINYCIRKLLEYSFSDFSSDQVICFVYIYEQILQQYDKLSDFYNACTRVGLTDGYGDYLSHKRFLSEMQDRIKKYRYHFTKEETAPKEAPQDAVEEEKPLITWWDSDDDGINFGSKNTEQEANYESNHAEKEWEKAVDVSIKDSSSTTSYHAEKEWERALDTSIVNSSSTTSYHAEKEWERSLCMNIVDLFMTASYQSGDGMDRSECSHDGKRIALDLKNWHRSNPFLTVEAVQNEEQGQLHQAAAMDVER